MTRWRNVFCEIACGAARQRKPATQYRTIMPDYFRSIGISLKAGRTLNESDTATAEKAVVVNEAFVKDYLADVANPLGQRVHIGKMFVRLR